MKIEYYDDDWDLCAREFNSEEELREILRTLRPGQFISILTKDEEDAIADEILLQMQFFPPNKVN